MVSYCSIEAMELLNDLPIVFQFFFVAFPLRNIREISLHYLVLIFVMILFAVFLYHLFVHFFIICLRVYLVFVSFVM